jgi:hypothetical protein
VVPRDKDLGLVGLREQVRHEEAAEHEDFGRDEDPMISLAKILNEAEQQN